jgi:hypothetical protein
MSWNNEYFNSDWNKPKFSFINIPKHYELYTTMANHTIHRFSRFEPNQLLLAKTYDKNRFVIVKKARQCGESTITSMYLAIQALEPNKKILILTRSKPSGACLIDMIKKYYLAIGITPLNNSYNNIILSNGSNIMFKILTPDAMRGYACDVIYITDIELLRNLNNIIDSVLPCLHNSNCQLIISSTPGGNDFKILYDKSKKPDSIFTSFDLGFYDNPMNDEKKYNAMVHALHNEDSIRQELDGEFIVQVDGHIFTI